MDRHHAKELLLNLLERARTTIDPTFLTSREIDALSAILGDKPVDEHSASLAERSIVAEAPSPPTLRAPGIRKEEIPDDLLVCIDFGTSFSKSFACVEDGGEIVDLIDLPIGAFGGSDNKLVTPSEMIIDDGTIYFGVHARKFIDDYQEPIERLIDSIKQYMTLGADVTHLARIKMEQVLDPDEVFYRRDILLLYLAHLMSLTEMALEDRSYSVNAKRRFTHPAWSDQNRQRNEEEMRILMAEAVVLARHFGARLQESLSVKEAREILDQLERVRNALPMHVIAEAVREATAAGAGAILSLPEGSRKTYIVLDVGAGTTDVTACICVNNPDWDRARVFEISSAAHAIKMAGNVLDSALLRLMLSKSIAAVGSTEYGAAVASLTRDRRTNKERLFQSDSSSVVAETPTGEALEVTLKEFLDYEPVREFTGAIRTLIGKAVAAAAGDAERVALVVTGGGAKLPIISQIAEEGVKVEDKRIGLMLEDTVPSYIRVHNPDLIEPYPQLAVAVGGTLPQLPEQRASVEEGLRQAPKLYISPIYKS